MAQKRPVWTPPRGHFNNCFWTDYSHKLGRPFRSYSNLERKHFLLIETDPDIIEFCEQPERIVQIVKGKPISAIFDCWILFSDGRQEYREVKYVEDLCPSSKNYRRNYLKLKAEKQYCVSNGIDFQLFTEENLLNREQLIYNLSMLVPYGNPQLSYKEIEILIADQLVNKVKMKINDLYGQILEERWKIKNTIYHLLYKGDISADLNYLPLGPNTEVCYAKAKDIFQNPIN